MNKNFHLSNQSNFISCVIYISNKVEYLAKKELREPLLEHILLYKYHCYVTGVIPDDD